MSRKHLIATACDFAHFDLAEDLLESIRAVAGNDYAVGFVRCCKTDLPEKITSLADIVVDASADYANFDSKSGYYVAFASIKPRIPELFPGFDLYTWIDADCWLQNDGALKRIEIASPHFDVCIHPEYDVHYAGFPTPNLRTLDIYERSMPKDVAPRILRLPMVNTGVVGARRDSRIWSMWHAELAALRTRFERGEAEFFSDQIPLHHLIHTSPELKVYPLRATDNWQTYASLPKISPSYRLREPTFPFEEISILHMAGPTKDNIYELEGEKFRLRRREFIEFARGRSRAAATRSLVP